MKRSCSVLVIALAVGAFSGQLSAVEIKGKVVEAKGDVVTVKLASELVPQVGDKAEIFFEIPGLDEKALVASGKVAKVEEDLVTIKIDKATGKLAKDQLASITSDKPGKRESGAAVATVNFDQLDKTRQQAYSIISTNNLKQIGIAFHNYHDAYAHFPGNIADKDGKPLLSWRVAILPFLEEDELYKQFKRDEPWDGPNNKKLIDKMPKVYRNPRFQKDDDKGGLTYYQGFSGAGGIVGAKKLRLADITSGSSRTLLVVEAGEPVLWTKPEDLVHDLKKPLPKLAGAGGYFLAAFCDGHVQRIPAKTDEKTLRCMIQRDCQETFKLPE